jgi:ribosomal protein S18 acetylase RimI-like enzyme
MDCLFFFLLEEYNFIYGVDKMEKVHIRKATKKDLIDVVELASQLYETEQQFDSNIRDGYYKTKEGRKELLKDIKNKERIFLIAIYKNDICGFIDGYIYNKEKVYKEKVAYLDRISVDNDYKGKGIGTNLIEAFEREVKIKEAKFIKLNAFHNNIPATSFYKKTGFYDYSTFYMKKIK